MSDLVTDLGTDLGGAEIGGAVVGGDSPPPPAPVDIVGTTVPLLERGESVECVGLDKLSDLTVEMRCGEALTIAGTRIPLAAVRGVFRGARLAVARAYMESRVGPVVGARPVFEGAVEVQDVGSASVTLSVQSDAAALAAVQIPRYPIQARCGNTLYDEGCTLAREDFVVSSSVAEVASRATFRAALSEDWSGGVVRFSGGANAGAERTPVSWTVDGWVTVWPPLPALPAVGDPFTAEPSCDHAPAGCNALGNLVHFRGQPFVPQESPLQSSAIRTLTLLVQFLPAAGETRHCNFRSDGTISFAVGESTDVFPAGSTVEIAGATLRAGSADTFSLDGTYAVTAQTGTTLTVTPTGPWALIDDWYSEQGGGGVSPVAAVSLGRAAILHVTDSAQGVDLSEYQHGTIEIVAGLVAGEIVRVAGVDFTAVSGVPGPNQWTVGAMPADSAANLAAAINGSSSANVTGVVRATVEDAVVTIGATVPVGMMVPTPNSHFVLGGTPVDGVIVTVPAFGAGADVKITAGGWMDAGGAQRNLDGTYTVLAVSAHTLVFENPESVNSGWASFAASPPLLAQIERA